MKKYTLAALSFMLLPMVAAAQSPFSDLLEEVQGFINDLIPLLIGLAVVFFLYTLARFMLSAGDPEKQKNAKGMMIYGIVVLVVMVSVWGLVNFVVDTLDLGGADVNDIPIPEAPQINS
jgi:hypothetical protein